MPITTPEQLAHAKLARQHIRDHPEQHDQGHFILEEPHCGTTACIAGHASLLAGARPLRGPNIREFTWVILPDGDEVRVSDHARSLLGLDEFESEPIFFNTDNVAALARFDQHIADGEIRLTAKES